MSGQIIDLSRQRPPARLQAEICIVGSGCGGATAARLLAEAGRDVVVLEEGSDRTGTQLTQRDGEMYDQLYMDRGGRMTEDFSISILQGRVLGGGGVINACDVVPMKEEVLAFWQKQYGLRDWTSARFAPHARQALKDLHTQTIREEQLNKANQLLREGTRKLGWKGEVMRHNRQGCAGLGTCLIGCPVNAKRNPRFVAIPLAQQAGARFLTRARAVRIHDAEKEVKRVEVRRLDPKGYHEGESFELRAKVVILAANAINSAQLLLRSGIGNDHVGRHLSLQPQLPIMAFFKERVDAFRGIPQAFAVTEFEQTCHPRYGLWGYRMEAIMGTPGIVSSLVPHTGVLGKQMMCLYPHIAASLLLAPDQPTGRVVLASDGRPVIHYEHRENHKARLRQAIKHAAQIYLAAGAQQVLVPLMEPLVIKSQADLANVNDVSFAPATAPLLSAHQQGGVRFSPSPQHGASNPEGAVYGARDVYVFDSSGFPSSASSHTMTPIIAASRLLSSQLLTRL